MTDPFEDSSEGIPLEEDILKKTREFVKSWTEFAADNFQLVFKTTGGFNNDKTLFEVPVNHTFFLTYVELSCDTTNTAPLAARGARIFINKIGRLITITYPNTASFESSTTNANFSMPIKINSGEKIILTTGDQTISAGSIIGFLIPKKIS